MAALKSKLWSVFDIYREGVLLTSVYTIEHLREANLLT